MIGDYEVVVGSTLIFLGKELLIVVCTFSFHKKSIHFLANLVYGMKRIRSLNPFI